MLGSREEQSSSGREREQIGGRSLRWRLTGEIEKLRERCTQNRQKRVFFGL